MRLPLLVSIAILGAGCVKSSVVECDDGTVCPEGTVCDPIGQRCVEPGGLVISEELVDIGSVDCGATVDRALNLTNFADEAISFTADSTLAEVAISPTSGTLAPGESLAVTLTADASSGSLALGAIEGAIFFTTEDEIIPAIVQLNIDGALVRTSEQALDFGIAALSQLPGPRTFTVFNDGTRDVEVELATPAMPFTVPDGPFNVPAGGSTDIEVTFEPRFIGEFNSPLGMSYVGPVCQKPDGDLALSGEISDAGLLVDTTILDFGTSACGVSAMTKDLTFTSQLGADQVLSFNVSGDATLYTEPNATPLGAGAQAMSSAERAPIGIPSTPGSKSATLSVTAAPSNESITIDLQHDVVGSVLSAVPGRVNFGLVGKDTQATQSVDVTNTGNAPANVQVTPATVPTPDGGSIRFTPSIFSVAEGETKRVDIVVVTNGGGYATNDISFTFNSSGQCSRAPIVSVDVVVGGQLEGLP